MNNFNYRLGFINDLVPIWFCGGKEDSGVDFMALPLRGWQLGTPLVMLPFKGSPFFLSTHQHIPTSSRHWTGSQSPLRESHFGM